MKKTICCLTALLLPLACIAACADYGSPQSTVADPIITAHTQPLASEKTATALPSGIPPGISDDTAQALTPLPPSLLRLLYLHPEAEILYPVRYNRNEYRWHFLIQLNAETAITITKLVIVDYLDGKPIDKGFVFEGDELREHIGAVTLKAGQSVDYAKCHMVTADFNYREFRFYCTDDYGNESVFKYGFALTGDTSLSVPVEGSGADPRLPGKAEYYELARTLGGVTLSEDKAESLVGKSPGEIRSNILTAGDLLAYIIASDMSIESGDIQESIGGYKWSYNRSAQEVLKNNGGNCGGISNMVNYLLKDKYEEVGFIHWSGNPGTGGHVINYIKHNGKYYAYDFQQFIGHMHGKNSDFPLAALDKIEDFPEFIRQYQDITIIVSYTSAGRHLPVALKEDSRAQYGLDFGTNYYAEGSDMKVLFVAPGFSVSAMPLPEQIPNWQR